MNTNSTVIMNGDAGGADADAADLVTDPRRQRQILIAMCAALIAVVASVSGLNVAQQDLALDLGASQGQLLWVINGYTMALAALLLPIGAIGDRWGRKPVLVSGLVLFSLANVMAGLATTTGMLLIARIVAGVAAAMIMPVTLSVITSSFPLEQRARAVGVWTGFAGAGGILGLFVSSFLIDYFTWPWLFAMPVLFAGVSLVLTLRVVGNSRESRRGRFDTIGSVLSAVAIGSLVLGIHEGPERGWTDGLTLAALVVGAVALAGFIVWELRHERPLLEIRLFADRALAAGSLTLLIVFAVMFGLFLVLVQFLQAVLGYSALRAAAGPAADGDGDDAAVGGGARDRQTFRYPPGADGRPRTVRHRDRCCSRRWCRPRAATGRSCPACSCWPSASAWR